MGDRDKELSHSVLQSSAKALRKSASIINPDDPAFANPPSMLDAINEYCTSHGEPVPQTRAEYCRCIFDSLAARYRQVFTWLCEFADFDIDTLHIIGGGSKNAFLNQLTADACGVKVLAGPQEATAIGNIMLQAKAAGAVKDIWEMRQIIAGSTEPEVFYPRP